MVGAQHPPPANPRARPADRRRDDHRPHADGPGQPVYVVGDIQKQSDVEGVATVSARLPAVVESLVGQDASADDIGRVVTAIGDAVERRLITLAEAELGGAPVPLHLGGPGLPGAPRQALAADQDNAIISSATRRPTPTSPGSRSSRGG